MRFGLITFLAAVMLMGCVHMDVKKNIKAINTLQPGDPQEYVLEKLGPPDIRHDIGDHRMVAFYRTNAEGGSNVQLTEAMCTAIAFENGRVVAVGEDPTERWRREEEARRHAAEIAERQRIEAQQAETAKHRIEAERKEKIAALEAEVRPVPAANATLNLKLYRQLLELAPNNERYQKKVAHYEERLAQQEKANEERARKTAQEKERQAWDKGREARNNTLRQYSGNDIAEMAIHDMGNGALYVWIKNVSRQVITTDPDHFTLIDSDGKRVPCQVSDSMDSVLEPGGIAHGKIEFAKTIIPKTLIFENQGSGRIEKSFR